MNYLELQNYNLHKTLLGGQAFNWEYIEGNFYGFVQDKIIKLKQHKNGIYWQTYPKNDDFEYIKNLLNLDVDYNSIINQISIDNHVKKALQQNNGLRILKQDFNQTLLSFMMATHKNIRAVKKSVKDLSTQFGIKVNVDGLDFYTFPATEVIANIELNSIKNLGLGFRSARFKEAANKLLNADLESKFFTKNLDLTRNNLLEFSGIGNKVADCIMVFSLGFYQIAPIDLWAYRVVVDLYNYNIPFNYNAISSWYDSKFGVNSAWAAQFLFEYLRENYKGIKNVSN